MKLPWVSRGQYDAMTSRLIAEVVREREAALDALRRHDALLARYHQLKLQGAAEVAPPTPAVTKPVDRIADAIDTASRGDAGIAALMRAQAIRDAGAGLSESDILTRIHRGNVPHDLLSPSSPSVSASSS